MASKKKIEPDPNSLVRRSYRVLLSQDNKIKELAEASGGAFSDNDVLRLALKAGLPHVENRIIPALTNNPETMDE